MNLFQFKFLDAYIQAVNANEKVVYSSSLLNISENGWVLILHGDMLLIYGENWRAVQLEEIKTDFNLNTYRNFTVTGDTELINQLLQLYQIPNAIQKERVFYKAHKIRLLDSGQLNIELGSMRNLAELAQMLQEYYHEEYDGQNDKTIEEMLSRVTHLIQTNAIYILRNQSHEILSFCTIINPDIGILFTRQNHRNNGFGKILLSYCSQLLLHYNDEIYLMTDKNKVSSNSACKRVGFEPFFNYQQLLINADQQ